MNKRLPLALLIMRLSIVLVMLLWTLDKFIRPEHAITVYQHFYFLSNISAQIMYVLAAIEIGIIICFVCGLVKRFSYGAIFVFHLISTLSTYQQYLKPFEEINLLFFTAWPMLAACLALYWLRDEDTLLNIKC